jgi:hypothetical protein
MTIQREQSKQKNRTKADVKSEEKKCEASKDSRPLRK